VLSLIINHRVFSPSSDWKVNSIEDFGNSVTPCTPTASRARGIAPSDARPRTAKPGVSCGIGAGCFRYGPWGRAESYAWYLERSKERKDSGASIRVPGFGIGKVGYIDLTPLVDHIATLEDQVQRLTEASPMWQIRVRQAEEQLKQLTAGTTDSDTEPEPNTVDTEGPQLLQESDPEPTGVLAWWKRLWGG